MNNSKTMKWQLMTRQSYRLKKATNWTHKTNALRHIFP
jgi:hypothetical protein